MILYVDSENKLKLTEKALMIPEFRSLRDYVKTTYNAGTVEIVFTFLHLMYDYDSDYIWEYLDEDERVEAIRSNTYKGKSFKMSKTIREAMEKYKSLYEREQVSLYIVMKNNLFKLKEYANSMVLMPPEITEEDMDGSGITGIPVDSKEFTMVNSMLPKQLQELEDFEIKLKEFTKNKIDIYGGGSLGAYE